MRAKAAIEQVGKDRENIVVTEIPYQVNKSRLVERIADLVQTKKIEGISDVRDESDRDGMRIVIEIKRGEESQLVLNHLYKLTQMQESFGMILLAITGGQPREMGLLELLRLFLEHRRDVVLRRTRFDLRKAEEREHILLGYQIALDHLDEVIKLIRGSSSRAEARENLCEYFENKTVSHLARAGERAETLKGVKLDRKRYGPRRRRDRPQLHPDRRHPRTAIAPPDAALGGRNPERARQVRENIAELKEILASEKRLKQVIVGELREVQKEYGDDRRTQIVDAVDEIKVEDLIADTDMAITISHAGYIKRTSVDVYRHQSRGGKGRIGAQHARRGLRRVSLRRLGAQLHSAVQLQRAASTG